MKTAIFFWALSVIACSELFCLPPSQRATAGQGYPDFAQSAKKECWYTARLAKAVHGATEAVCFRGRIDVATSGSVYEVDFLHKSKECLCLPCTGFSQRRK